MTAKPTLGAPGRTPTYGETVLYRGQTFTCRGRNKQGNQFRWESRCVVCDAPYSFWTGSASTYIVRTCKAHRGALPRKTASVFD